VTRHAGDSPPRDVNRALARRARMQGIIAEDVAFGVLHGPIDFPLVSSKYAVRADPPTKIERMPAAGQPRFYFNFKVLDGQWKAPESVGERSAAAFSEVLFRQHLAENCIAECSKCLFVVACRSM
jgi:hypothetical protein